MAYIDSDEWTCSGDNVALDATTGTHPDFMASRLLGSRHQQVGSKFVVGHVGTSTDVQALGCVSSGNVPAHRSVPMCWTLLSLVESPSHW